MRTAPERILPGVAPAASRSRYDRRCWQRCWSAPYGRVREAVVMNEDVFALPVAERLCAHVSVRQIGELTVIVVDHPRVRAAVALQGAHLIAWQPAGEEPVIWLSDATAFEEGVAIRG